jgi:hypothetical protein
MSAYKPMFLNRDEIFIPSPVSVESVVRLSRSVSAVHLEPGSDPGRARLGEIRTLQVGETVELCGGGYNDKTVKVRSSGEFFFVFRADLNPEPFN